MAAVRAACVFALICYTLLALVVVRRARRRREARYFLLYLMTMMIWQIGQTVAAFAGNPDTALFGYKLVLAFSASFGFFYAMSIREILGIHSLKWLVSIGWVLTIATPIYTFAGGPGMITGVYQEPGWPLYLPDIGNVAVFIGATAYLYLGYSLVLLVRARAASTSTIERNRLTYLLVGIPIVIMGTAVNFFPETRGYPFDTAAHVINALLVAYAILRYRLLDIQLVVRKGLRYSVTTVTITVIYFLLVSVAVQVFHLVSNVQVLLLSVIMAVLAALLVQPLRDNLQARVDKQFFREKYDAAQMLQRLSESAASVLDIGRLTDMILAEVSDTIHIERLAFFLRDEAGGYRLAASRGFSQETDWSFRADYPLITYLVANPHIFVAERLDRLPLARAFRLEERERWQQLGAEILAPVITKGSLVGLLVVGPKRSDAEYSADDHHVLMAVANQTAVAVENARLYASIQHELAERRRAEEQILESLHEKEVLLKEIHHRVKNNLQVIYSLLSLQAQYAQDPATLEILRDSQNRIRSMALIHEKLYQSANFADIDFGEYLSTLSAHLCHSYETANRSIKLVLEAAPIRLPLDTALPCALIASELISNALKHAFVGRNEGVLCVEVGSREDGMVALEVADNGIGLPKIASAEARGPTLGMQLVAGLVRQLDGSLQIINGVGTRFVVSFRPEGT